ncbi:MAG: baseplate assembly protein [Silanimonas sp.]|nr:MAG: baseplate assembly protein [Silanimonas sp.]
MSSTFAAVDLSRLPAPAVVEPLDFEAIFGAMLADLRSRDPAFDALTEADPAYKLLEVCAYRELLLRQRVNDAARGVMLAHAVGSDLDQLGALLGVQRLMLDPGDPQALPPRPPAYESDADFRRRIQLAPQRFSVAGPAGAYLYHALAAHPDVLDASVTSPAPGEVLVTILSRSGDGTPAPATLDAVLAALSADDVRPLTDHVSVQPAQIVPYTVAATLYTRPGPDASVVLAEAQSRLQAYVESVRRLGHDVPRSGLYAALHVEGVQRVELATPASDLILDAGQAGHCTAIELTHGGTDV